MNSHYTELMNHYKGYVDAYDALYKLKTNEEDDINKVYHVIKSQLIETKIASPISILLDINDLLIYINRYLKSYILIAKKIYDDYLHGKTQDIPKVLLSILNKEYGIYSGHDESLTENDPKKYYYYYLLHFHEKNSLLWAIMNDDKSLFISLIESDGFDKDQVINSYFFPWSMNGNSLLEICCYYGSAQCFKLLRTKFNSEITQACLDFSFLGGNPEIMSECLKVQKPKENCMKNAIISHNIDFVTFLVNEYDLEIDLEMCG